MYLCWHAEWQGQWNHSKHWAWIQQIQKVKHQNWGETGK